MLLAYETLTYWGEGAAAMIADGVAATLFDIGGYGRAESIASGVSAMPQAHLTGLKGSPAVLSGAGVITTASPKARARLLLAVQIGFKPSAFDIAQAVLNALASQYNIPGTIGEAIQAGGGAGGLTTEQAEQLENALSVDDFLALRN